MEQSEIKKDLKTRNKNQLMKIAQENNIVLDGALPIKQMRKNLLIAILAKAEAKKELEHNDSIANAEADTVSGGEPMTDEQRAEVDAAAAEAAADEVEETEADANQWSMLQKYLSGSLTSVQVQFLDRIANDIQNIKTAVPPFTVEKLEAAIKEWIGGLEDLV